MINGIVVANDEGKLSPLLSNIMLDELDKELEKRGHIFCRYADDCAPRRRTYAIQKMMVGPSEIAVQAEVSNHLKLL